MSSIERETLRSPLLFLGAMLAVFAATAAHATDPDSGAQSVRTAQSSTAADAPDKTRSPAKAGTPARVGAPAKVGAPVTAGASAKSNAPAAGSVPSGSGARAPSNATAATTPPGAPRRIDLSLGDLRRIYAPAELQPPPVEPEDIVIESHRAQDYSVHEKAPISSGLAAPFWAISNPLEAWRVLLPDPNAPPPGPPVVTPTLQSSPLPY